MSEETIVALALEQPDPAARAAFLVEACGEDAALRRRVEALLLAREQGGDSLERLTVLKPEAPARETPSLALRASVEQVAGHPGRPEATADFTPEGQEEGSLPAHTMAEGADEQREPARQANLAVGEFTEALEARQDVTEDLTGLTSREMPARPVDDPGATIGLPCERNPELTDSPLGEAGKRTDNKNDLTFLAPAQEAGSLGRLDHFEVLEVVGRGGFGIVLKARDTKLQRINAIKVLAPQLAASGTARRRFAREARAAAAVRDEHVVAIHGVHERGPVPYLVMEFIAGITLDERLKQGGPLEVKEVLRIGMQAARGLAAAHAQGLIHRDVKPGNILLESGLDRVKITDFGLARAADDASITQSGVIAGTPMYMSPEQARGEPVDHRSDLFSLGSVLYTLCTGHPAFRAPSTMAVLKRVCQEVPKPIRECNPEVPMWLCAVVGKLLAKKPEDRFQSAAEVADLLGQFLAHLQQPDTVAPPPPVAGVGAWTPGRRRKRTLLAVAAVALVVVAVGGYLALRPGDNSTPPKDKGGQEPKAWRPRTLEELAALSSPLDGRQREQIPAALLALAGGGDSAAAPAELVAILGDARFRLPSQGRSDRITMDREGKWLAVANRDAVAVFDVRTGELVRTLTGHNGTVNAIAFSPDGKTLAGGNITGDHTLKVWDLKTGHVTATLKGHTNHIWSVVYSPDGTRLVSAGEDAVKVWDLKTGEVSRTLRAKARGFFRIGLSPDGKKIVCGDTPSRTAKVFATDTGELLATLRGHAFQLNTAAFSPDGKLLATGSHKELLIWNADKLELLKRVESPAGWLAFDPDGKTLLTADVNQNGPDQNHIVTRWDLKTFEGKALPSLGKRLGWTNFHLSTDGKTLYSNVGNGRDREQVIRVYDAATGKELFPRQGHVGEVWTVAVSPDGRAIASGGANGTVRLWDLAAWKAGDPQPPSRLLAGHTATIDSVAFSPDGKLVASASQDGTIRLWDVTTGETVRTLARESKGTASEVAFSPDGKILATGEEDGSVRLWDVASGEEQSPLRWHDRRVSSVAFSPDNRFLASAGFHDRKVHLTDLRTSLSVQTFSAPGGGAEIKVAFGGDGRTLAYGGGDDTIRLWDLEAKKETVLTGGGPNLDGLAVGPTGRFVAATGGGAVRFWHRNAPRQSLVIGPGPFGSTARHVAFTPEGRYVVVAGFNGTVSILRTPTPPTPYNPSPARKLPNAAELAKRPSPLDGLKQANLPPELAALLGEARFRLPKVGQNSWMAMDREGKFLAVPNADVVAIFDARTGELVRTLTGHNGRVYTVAFSPDGKFLAGGNWEGDDTIKVWDLKTGEVTATLKGRVAGLWSLAFSPDGKRLVSAAADAVKVWDLKTGEVSRTLEVRVDWCWQLGLSPDGKKIVCGDQPSKTFRVFDIESGDLLATLKGHTAGVRAATYSPDGKLLATGSDTELLLWDAEKLKQLKKFDTSAQWLAFEPGGKTLLTARHDQNGADRNHVVTRWDLKTFEGKPLPSLSNLSGWTVFQLSPDGKTLYAHVNAQDPNGPAERCVRPYDAATGKALFPRQGHSGQVRSVAVSPDGKRLASAGGDGAIRIWDLSTGKQLHAIARPGQAYAVAFSPNGSTLAASWHKGPPVLLDASGGNVRTLSGGGPRVETRGYSQIAFSPNGTLLAASGGDGMVRVWDVPSGRVRRTFWAGPGQTLSPTFSPDGKVLAAGSEGGTVALWDLATGWQVGALPQQRGAVMGVGFHPDGRSLAVGGYWRGDTLGPDSPKFTVTPTDGPNKGQAGRFVSKTYTRQLEAGQQYRFVMTSLDEKLAPLLVVDEAGDGKQLHSSRGVPTNGHSRAEITLKPTKATTCKVIACAESGQGWFELIMYRGTTSSDWMGVGYAPVYDLATGKETHRVAGHNSGITACAWRADGQVLLTAGDDSTVRAWNLGVSPPVGHPLRVLPSGSVHGVAFTPEGRYAAVATPDGEIPILRIPNPPPPYDPGPARPVPDPKELAARPAAADALKRESIPAGLLKLAGGGDPARVPPEVVAILGDARFRLPKAGLNSWMATDREGKFLAVPNADVVALFDARTGELVRTLTGSGRMYAVAFSPDGKSLAGGNWEGDKTHSSSIKVWDLKTGNVTATIACDAGWIWSLAFSPDGKRLFAAADHAVKVWDLKTGQVSRTLEARGDGFVQLGLSPDGRKLVCGDRASKTARVFDADTGDLLATLPGYTTLVSAAAFSADGNLLATGGPTELLVWSADKFKLVKRVESPASWLAFEPGGKTLLTAGHDQNGADRNHVVTRWDLKTFEGKPLPSLSKRAGWTVFHLSPDGKTLYSLVADGQDSERRIRVYDAATGKELLSPQGHREKIWSVAFSPDGQALASVSMDPGVRLWDVATGKSERVLPHEQGFWSVAFSADGKLIAAGEVEGTVVLYDAATGKKLRTLPATKSSVRAVAFSPDGSLVAGTTFAGVVHVWEVATGRLRHTLAGRREAAWSVAFSPDGKTLATGWGWDGGEVRLFDVATGWEVADLRVGVNGVRWLGFHPNGRSLGIVGFDDTGVPHDPVTFGVWDLATRKELRRMAVSGKGHIAGAWRADGLLMASSGSEDGTVRLWSTDGKPDRHQVIQLYPPKTQWLHGLAMSPEGRHLATANPDGTISVLRISDPPPAYDPGPARPVPDPKKLASLPAAADTLKREAIPPSLLKLAGGGDPARVPPEVVAILGDARFRLPKGTETAWMAQDREGKFLAIPHSGSVSVFDARTGELLRILTGTGRMFAVAVSPDGSFVAGGNVWERDDQKTSALKVWDMKTGQVRLTLESGIGGLVGASFSKDGKRLFASGPGGVQMWDMTGKSVRTFKSSGESADKFRLALSPDGKRVVCNDTPRTLKVWEIEGDNPARTLQGHTLDPQKADFSPDGKLLATGSDKELLLWDADKLELVKKIDTPAGWLAFAPDGKTILTAQHGPGRPLTKTDVVTRWDLATYEGKALPPLSQRPGWPLYYLSPDGKTLYAHVNHWPESERYIRAYDAATGKELSPPRGHTSQVWSVAFSPDGKRLASVSHDPGVRLWDVEGKPERVLPNEQGFWSVAFSADGKRIAAGEIEGTVVLYDATTGEKLRTLPALKSQVRTVAFSPDGSLVAGTTLAGVVHVWEVATGRLRHTLAGQRSRAWCVAFSPDGKTLATGWAWGEVRLYDVATGWEVADLRIGVGDFWVRWLGFHPDGRSLGIGGKGAVAVQDLSVWDLATRKEIRRMPVSTLRRNALGRPGNPDFLTWFGHLGGAWRSDGLLLASCDARHGTVRLWSTDGKPEREQVIRLYPPNTPWLHGLTMSPEGRHLATANPDGTVTILRLAGPGEVFAPKAPPLLKALAGHTGKVLSVAYSPDGKRLASGGDEDVRIWDAKTGQLIHSLPVQGKGKGFLALTFSPDGKFVLTAPHDLPSGETKNPITIWEVETGKLAGTLEGHSRALLQISFSPDGKALVSGGHDATIRVWDFEKRAEVRAIPSPDGNWVRAVIVSSSGTLAVGSFKGNYLLDLDGKLLTTIPWETNPAVLAFSPDGQQLAAMHFTKGWVKVWDSKTGKEVRTWQAHDGRNNGVAFSRDGRVLATPGEDRAVRLWEVATGRQLAELPHDGEAYAVAFAPDGKTLATTGIDDRLVKLWDVSEVLRSARPAK